VNGGRGGAGQMEWTDDDDDDDDDDALLLASNTVARA